MNLPIATRLAAYDAAHRSPDPMPMTSHVCHFFASYNCFAPRPTRSAAYDDAHCPPDPMPMTSHVCHFFASSYACSARVVS
eukprot:362014-Chlamydomonas_euryale.AAC.2